MAPLSRAGGLTERIIALHELLDSLGLRHQFGGAIALAWYRNPRATRDIDVNITLAPEHAAAVLGALRHIGVESGAAECKQIERDGQGRLGWADTYLDLFFATLPLHLQMAERARTVAFGPVLLPILAPEHLVICKAIFARPKDWVDIEAILNSDTILDRALVIGWMDELLGAQAQQTLRLRAMFPQ